MDMKVYVRILALCSFSLVALLVPCFGEDFTPSSSFDLPWNSLGLEFDHRSSATVISGGPFMERPVVESAGSLRLSQAEQSPKLEEDFEDYPEEAPEGFIPDPIEPLNRVFFHFNDKLYFWVFKPVATGYKRVVPEPARLTVRNFFSNLTMPIRAVNCLLQGKFGGFGNELLRFLVNSTVGFLGFQDPAKTALGIAKQDEDFGQTLGFYGLGPGFYINWPLIGPSSLRSTFGIAGDIYLDPMAYISFDFTEYVFIRAGDRVNETSLALGEYESLKKASLDPYVALRDAYYQYRQNKIKD